VTAAPATLPLTPPETPPSDPLADLVAVLKDRLAPPAALIAKDELAVMLVTTPATIDRMRAAGKLGPQPFRVGGLKWDRAEVLAWIANPVRPGELADAEQWPAVRQMIERRKAKAGRVPHSA
jgi:predicted DNA-binding transcriptional regulator AlpA